MALTTEEYKKLRSQVVELVKRGYFPGQTVEEILQIRLKQLEEEQLKKQK